MSRLESLTHRLPPVVIDRLRPVVGMARRARDNAARRARGNAARRARDNAARRAFASKALPPGPSPYVQWHGPSAPTTAAVASCTMVADLILVQGSADADAQVELELGDGQRIAIAHRFPHPSTPHGPATCFELTLDHTAVGFTSSTATLLVDGKAQHDVIDLPAPPRPGVMVGVETLDRCPACDHAEMSLTGRRQHLQMMTCKRCNLVMTNPRPAEDHTLVRYSDRYFDEEYLPSQQLSPALSAHIDAILDHAEPAKAVSATLFELGVGGGNLSARAVERGWSVRGTDVNPASVAHASTRGLDVWQENADHATGLGGTYGAIISEMSIEHVRRPEHFCALAAGALVPGGLLVIYTVSAEGESFAHSGMASPLVGPAEHLFLYSAGSLVALCERQGLRVETVWRNNTGDEIGIVATKRGDRSNPAIT